MQAKQRALPNRVDEQYILPVLFLMVNITSVIWFYLINEYAKPIDIFEKQYGFDQAVAVFYLSELELQILFFSVVLLITPIYLKYRKRWFLIVITLMQLGALYGFFA
ncbi:MAG: hypothetical protein AAGC88_00930 [Bacteroidota bacterium]